ncbi:PREDICTED: leucine dehydrogenase-like, partial [Priapulus caudatus]|uniref:Leucine dehydrogenase-like n=1 Tax=Priapulus caudatus TaxID=37621 RepID=A0ABM1F4N1_PRICU
MYRVFSKLQGGRICGRVTGAFASRENVGLSVAADGVVVGRRSQQHDVGLLSLPTCPSNIYHVSARSYSQNTKSTRLLGLSPEEFADYLKNKSIRRCFAVFDHEERKVKFSHPEIEELGALFSSENADFKNHEVVFLQLGIRTNCLMGAIVWQSCRGQAQGGIKYWHYPTMEAFLRDGLRLATTVGIKAALAGLWVGGAKGLIAKPREPKFSMPDFRQDLFFDYGDFVTSLNGCFVACEDIGVNLVDLNNVHSRTRYVSGVSEDLGGCGNPSEHTASGVVRAMEGALDFMGMGTLEGKSIAVQGAGNVGRVLIDRLLDMDVGSIYVTDVHRNQLDTVHDMFSQR